MKPYPGGSKTIKVLSKVHQWKQKIMIAKLWWLCFTPIVPLFIVQLMTLMIKY